MPVKSGIQCEGINYNNKKGTYPCGKSASFNYKGLQPKFCKTHANNIDKKMVNVQNNDFCIYEDCTLKPYKKGIKYCEDHDFDNADLTLEEKMKSSKVCKYKDCKNSSNYNYKDKQPKFCKDHAIIISGKELGGHISQMRNVKNTTCKYYIDDENDCIAIATCKINGIKMYCPNHAKVEKVTEIMKSTVIKKKCKFENCNIIPSYGYLNGNNKKIYICCQSHIKNLQPFYEQEIKQLYKECKIEGCNERARKESEEGKHDIAYCYKHGKELNDNSKKKCQFEGGCKKEATHNYKEIREPILCKDHKQDNMRSKKNICCNYKDCIIDGNFSLNKDDKERYCKDHKSDNMYHYISEICKNCNKFLERNESTECSNCNPTIYLNSKEEQVRKLLINNNIEFEYNKGIKGTNNNNPLKPDFKINCENYYIIIEVDENQHKRYKDEYEINRIKKIREKLDKNIIILRFNPDSFKVNNKLNQIHFEDRLKFLLSIIKELINEQNTSYIELYKMYYDCKCTSYCSFMHKEENL